MNRRVAIDIGNTAIKTAVFEDREMVDQQHLSPSQLDGFIATIDLPTMISVTGKQPDVATAKHIHILTADTPLPIEVDYETSETLGPDRIANACGVLGHEHRGDFLVIDVGSCITYDVIERKKKFVGGAISPGVKMRFRSMNNFTSALPLVDIGEGSAFPARSTAENLRSGVYQGILGEMERIIRLTEEQYDDLAVVITGGDSTLFAKALENPIFADPNLTLRGLNEILLSLSI